MKKKIVVIGGGFVGSYCSKNLEKYFDVTLIDTKDYFEFTPSILRSLVEPKHLRKIQIFHKHYLEKTKIVLGSVDKFTYKEVFVGKEKYSYDYLVVASGSTYKSPFKRENILRPNRGIELRKYADRLKKSDKILVVGGGLVGIELTGEILDKYPYKEITLIQKNSKLVPRNNLKTSRIVEMYLLGKGVNIIKNKIFSDKEISNYDLIFFCTGIKPNLDFFKKKMECDKFLRVKGFSNVFMGGDVAGINEEKTAQNAVEHAKVIVENIKRLESNKNLVKYSSKKRVFLISLGKRRGVLEYKNFVWFGIIPAWLKNFVEKKYMADMKS
jgi:NADH dehydrogenase FAD-containing subunit